MISLRSGQENGPGVDPGAKRVKRCRRVRGYPEISAVN